MTQDTRIWLMNSRFRRHLVFWIVWVLSFTFIKSFGESLDTYLAWFVYYILTLPIFIVHTYLIVYWLVPLFMKGWKILFFAGFFVVLMFLFSFLELFVSVDLLSKWHPNVFDGSESYRHLSGLLINGVGNLYIVLVFVATKMVRSWYLSENEKKSLEQKELLIERADVNARVQPEMLLSLMDSIRQLAGKSIENIPVLISSLSELMNDVMQANEVQLHRVDEEIAILKKLLKIYSIIHAGREVKLRVSGDELHRFRIPAFIMFSPIDVILRVHDYKNLKGFTVVVGEKDMTSRVDFSVQFGSISDGGFSVGPIQESINSYFPGRYVVGVGLDGMSFWVEEVGVNVVH